MTHNRFYSCRRCLRKYTDKDALKRHQKIEHGRQEQGRAVYDTVEDDICPYCNHRFAGNAGVDRHLRFNKKCSALHEAWADDVSSAAASAYASSSAESSSDSDRFDNGSEVGTEDDEMGSPHNSDIGDMSVDSLDPNVQLDNTKDSVVSDEGADLEEGVDTGGHRVYVEKFPNPHVGQPIRKANANDLPPHHRNYPDVGALANPEAFEIAQLLMESGVSGRFRNRYLALKRVS